MPDTFAITVIFIVVATGIAAFVRRIRRDKCLKDFQGYIVTLKDVNGNMDQGRLHVENTGLAFRYSRPSQTEDGQMRTGRLLYKAEYSSLYALVRFHDDLDGANRRKRQRDLERTYHPHLGRRWRRKILNVFKTIRDSIGEVVTLLLAQVKKSPGAGRVLAGQDKYISQMQQEALGMVGASYEPLLEPCIGHQVLVEVTARDSRHELRGILKDYSAEFVEIMDVDYAPDPERPPRKADLILPRSHGVVRYYAE
jgi:hypothetical protein